jgi:hypothetical protein
MQIDMMKCHLFVKTGGTLLMKNNDDAVRRAKNTAKIQARIERQRERYS